MDRFIVGTGRCGSTLLSRMLSQHPRVLSVFEFFTGLDAARRFGSAPIGGPALADLLAADQPVVNMALRRGHGAPEITYPFGAPHARYTRDDAIPWLLVSALPRISDDPDALFDALVRHASGRPDATPAEHYRAVFAWLCQRSGRDLWIERSGSSIEYVGALDALFPRARFVHLHRDGPETALSMREHRLYRLAISFLFDLPPAGTGRDALSALDRAPRAADDPILARLEGELPVEAYGRYWTHQLRQGSEALARIAPQRRLELRFEDLVARPHECLEALARFFELPGAGDWIARAAGLVRGAPPLRAPHLAPDERRRLESACAPGMRLLGRSGDAPGVRA